MYTHEGVVVSVYVNMFVSLSMGDKRLMSHPMKISHSLSLVFCSRDGKGEDVSSHHEEKKTEREEVRMCANHDLCILNVDGIHASSFSQQPHSTS